MLIRPAIDDTDPIRYRRPTPDGQFSGNIIDEAMRPPYCLISRCYPDGAIADDDPMSIDRPGQGALPACPAGGVGGGSGPYTAGRRWRVPSAAAAQRASPRS